MRSELNHLSMRLVALLKVSGLFRKLQLGVLVHLLQVGHRQSLQ